MYTLIICLFIACLLPYLIKIPMVFAINKQFGHYDNAHPRAQQHLLTGFGARTVAAHQNSFESLIIFTAAIATALATNHTGYTIRSLAVAYIVIRLVYSVMYLFNFSTLRSLVWALGFIASLAIIWLCLP